VDVPDEALRRQPPNAEVVRLEQLREEMKRKIHDKYGTPISCAKETQL
jgi:hypothetical protein